jgi:hypothetical protein
MQRRENNVQSFEKLRQVRLLLSFFLSEILMLTLASWMGMYKCLCAQVVEFVDLGHLGTQAWSIYCPFSSPLP